MMDDMVKQLRNRDEISPKTPFTMVHRRLGKKAYVKLSMEAYMRGELVVPLYNLYYTYVMYI